MCRSWFPKMVPNEMYLYIVTFLCSSQLPLTSVLVLWLTWTCRMLWKFCCTISRMEPQEGPAASAFMFLGALSYNVRHSATLLERSCGEASWSGHVERKRPWRGPRPQSSCPIHPWAVQLPRWVNKHLHGKVIWDDPAPEDRHHMEQRWPLLLCPVWITH